MTTHKRKKVAKYRGSKTHGGGAMKKRRGAGNRGGRGRAGSGKRCDSKKPKIWTNKYYFGKHGFRKKSPSEKIVATNVGYLDEKIGSFRNRGLAAEKAGAYEIDLAALGFNKLLGSGKITKKIVIKTKYAADRAVEKVRRSGGEVILPKKQEKDIKTEAPKEVVKKEPENPEKEQKRS